MHLPDASDTVFPLLDGHGISQWMVVLKKKCLLYSVQMH